MKWYESPMFYRLGLVLITSSFLIWLIPLATPFTSLSPQVKAGVIVGSIITAEIMFWVGCLLVGKEMVAKLKKRFNPAKWRKRDEQR